MGHREFCAQFISVLGKGDWDAMNAMLDPEFEVIEAEGLPYAGLFKGHDGWRQLSNAVLATWSGFRLGPPEILGETEDTVVVRFDMRGKSRKTGKPFETSVLELWRFRGDKLKRIEPHYFDTHLLAMANTEDAPAASSLNKEG